MQVVLTGFMGTGKSTVGSLVSEALGLDFVDTDQLIELRHGPIETIFRDRGEHEFRRIEREVAVELAERADIVISTGGRLMLDPANAAYLGRADVFCLVATPDEIMERVASDPSPTERPLLAGSDTRQRIIDLLDERADAYGQFRQISTSARSPVEVADEIVALLRRKERHVPTSGIVARMRTRLQRFGSS